MDQTLPLTRYQHVAAIDAMCGSFNPDDVRSALEQAGVASSDSRECADRLMAIENASGRIANVDGWTYRWIG
jgi:hypothetical protein